MKLHFLRYFVVLAEELHFGRAADRLCITQPPLSLALKSLEGELDVQLLLRSSKHVELTPAGSAFLEEARDILDRVARAGSNAKAVAKGVRGRLELGITGSLVYRGVPSIVRNFMHQMSGIEVVLREMSTGEQLDALLHGQLDGGFLNAAVVPPKLESIPLGFDEFILCLPESHPRANSSSVKLKDIADDSFVMFSREVAPANYDNVIATFSAAGVHPRTVHAARQWLTVVALVSEGMGVSLVPSSVSRSGMAGVKFVRLDGVAAPAPALFAWDPINVSQALVGFIASVRVASVAV
jgi:DNA-binding transcriptional LysR family regulator